MRPTADDVLTALELISSRVPDRHITPDAPMAASWMPDLVRYDRVAVFKAAREWGGLRFPSAGEFLAACAEAAKQVAAEEAAKYAAGELALVACPEACEDGWLYAKVDHLGGNATTVRPCERCRPIEYAVWRHRTARPDHDPERCPDCISIRKSKEPLPQWFLDAREAAVRPRQTAETF